MRKYGESKTTRIMMATVPHVISGLGLRKFQADEFLLTRVYIARMVRRCLRVLRAHGQMGPPLGHNCCYEIISLHQSK